MNVTDWLDVAKARADAATDGPWEMDGDEIQRYLPGASGRIRADIATALGVTA